MKSLSKAIVAVALLANLAFSATLRLGGEFPRRPQQAVLAPSKNSWEFAEKRVRKMSVDEKVGQLVHVGINARFANQESAFFKDLKRHVVENKIGGVIFFGAPIYETAHLANRMQEHAETPL